MTRVTWGSEGNISQEQIKEHIISNKSHDYYANNNEREEKYFRHGNKMHLAQYIYKLMYMHKLKCKSEL